MTSPSPIGTGHQHSEDRTVRDIVEYSPDQVNEIWCRKILRQVLQSLELQYAMRMPHRPISPDTIVFHGNGEPLLVPTPGADSEGDEAADLHALASVIHYAITSELSPSGPLAGRADGYSDSLVTAIDLCMAPDPAQRPKTIEALRNLLGIVPLGPVPAAPAAPAAAPAAAPVFAPAIDAASAPAATPARILAGLSRWQRWALAIGGGGVLLALAIAMFAELRDSGADRIVLKLPPADTGRAATPPALPERIRPAPRGPDNADHAAGPPAPAPAPVPAVPPSGDFAYKLQIQPWGVVYVDGVDRGVSPPIKRLVLAPGRYSVRVTNPNFHDRVLEIDTAAGGDSIAVDFTENDK